MWDLLHDFCSPQTNQVITVDQTGVTRGPSYITFCHCNCHQSHTLPLPRQLILMKATGPKRSRTPKVWTPHCAIRQEESLQGVNSLSSLTLTYSANKVIPRFSESAKCQGVWLQYTHTASTLNSVWTATQCILHPRCVPLHPVYLYLNRQPRLYLSAYLCPAWRSGNSWQKCKNRNCKFNLAALAVNMPLILELNKLLELWVSEQPGCTPWGSDSWISI